MAELDIGKHCSVAACNLLDFLPVKCDKCQFFFCKEHHFYEYHNCLKLVERDVPENQKFVQYQCSYRNCEKTELVDVKCSECQKNFCFQHRCQPDHDCIELQNKMKDKMPETSKLIQNILGSARSNGIELGTKKIVSEKSRATAAKLALMKMKQKAVGDQGLPMDQRFYFSVSCSEKSSSSCVFFDRHWTVGRTVDALAKTFKLHNTNNIQNAPKLVLSCDDEGSSFFSAPKSWKELLESQEIFNGTTLYLRLIGS